MRHEDLGRCFVAQALSWLRIQVMGEVDKLLLSDVGQIISPGSQNQLLAPIPSSKALKAENSVPRSKVKLRRAKDGNGEKAWMILSMIGRE